MGRLVRCRKGKEMCIEMVMMLASTITSCSDLVPPHAPAGGGRGWIVVKMDSYSEWRLVKM